MEFICTSWSCLLSLSLRFFEEKTANTWGVGNFCETTMRHTYMWLSYPSFNHTIVNSIFLNRLDFKSDIHIEPHFCNPIKPAANATLPSTLELRLPHHGAATTRRPSPRRDVRVAVPVDWGDNGASGAHGSAAIGDIETISFFGHQFFFVEHALPLLAPTNDQ